MHETPERDRGDGRAAGQPQGLGPEAYLCSTSQGSRPEDAPLPTAQNGAAPGAGMVCGAKRIRSLYLPWMTGVTPKLSTTTPPKGLASVSTINAATMRLCRADHPASRHPVAAGGSCIMRASGESPSPTRVVARLATRRPVHRGARGYPAPFSGRSRYTRTGRVVSRTRSSASSLMILRYRGRLWPYAPRIRRSYLSTANAFRISSTKSPLAIFLTGLCP